MAIYRVTRTSQPGLAPASGSLVPGQLAVEMATQPNPRLWVGVPTNIDPTGRRLIVSGGGGGGGGGSFPEAPTDGQLYGRDGETQSWLPVLPITGGTLLGPLNLSGPNFSANGAVPLEQIGTIFGFPIAANPPANPIEGQIFYNQSTGQLEYWNGSAWVPSPGFLPLSGGDMVGNLILDGPPSGAGNPNQAATRGYVDEHITGAVQFIGTLNAQTGVVTYTQSSGINDVTPPAVPPTGLIPPAQAKDDYIIVAVSGTMPASSPYLPNVPMQVGDWVISDGTQWYLIQVSGEEVLAENVAVSPTILGQGNVQAALNALLQNFINYAPLVSPGLQGVPTTPTPPTNDHSQQVANTAWVLAQIALAAGGTGDISQVLFLGDLNGSANAGTGNFFDQLTLSGDSTGSNPSTLPNYIDSIELTTDAVSTP